MTRLEAIRSLRTHDHAILKGEYARKIGKVFGIEKVPTHSIQDNRSEHKGANFPDLKEGEWAKDMLEAHQLACLIARHLKVEYPDMFGIGSLLRSACGAVEEYLLAKPQ